MRKLLLVDSLGLLFRTYYAFSEGSGGMLTHPSTGLPIFAIYGYFRSLVKLLKDYSPQALAICWDSKTKTWREEEYPDYKQNRKEPPEDLLYQIEQAQAIVEVLGLPSLQVEGYEADDLLATMANQFEKDFDKIYLFTGDKDCFQLLSDRVVMLRQEKKGINLIDVDALYSRLKITPKEVPDFMGLVGDSSDNLPGVKGIGEKTASKLISQYHSLENLYEHLEEISLGVRKKLEAGKESAFLTRKLATLCRDIPIKADVQKFLLPSMEELYKQMVQHFKPLGFRSIINDLSALIQPALNKHRAAEVDYRLIDKEDRFLEWLGTIKGVKRIAIDTETTSPDPLSAELLGISVSIGEGKAVYIVPNQHLPLEVIQQKLRPILEDPHIEKVGQNIKYDLHVLINYGLFSLSLNCGIAFDTMIAGFLLKSNDRRNNLDDLAEDYLGYQTIRYSEVANKQGSLFGVDPEKVKDYACEDADITLRLYHVLSKELQREGLDKINQKVEVPLISVLVKMERAGILVDPSFLETLDRQYEQKLEDLAQSIYRHAGETFRIQSTKDLQYILYQKLGLRPQKKTKTGQSTDEQTLEKLRDDHPIVPLLLQYRKLSKLKQSYSHSLLHRIHPQTGRIHTQFSQIIARTGRLSSSQPNLQQIPKKGDGKIVRKAFIPEQGFGFLSLDYSQVELRILAHFSEDPRLIEAFQKGVDIHTQTASEIFAIPPDSVIDEQREIAKTINYSIIYGITAYGLAERLRIEPATAKEYIDIYFTRYPRVKEFIDKTVSFAKKHGYVETLFGRKRRIPDIQSPNHYIREAAKRVAINTPIQGTSADIIKIAMIEIDRAMEERNLRSRMLLQIHDELLFEVREEEKEEMIELALSIMQKPGGLSLQVPLAIHQKWGYDWYAVS